MRILMCSVADLTGDTGGGSGGAGDITGNGTVAAAAATGDNNAATGDAAGSQPTPPEWLAGLSDDGLKGNDALKSVPSVDDLAKGYIEAMEAKAAMTAPDSPDGYELEAAREFGPEAEKTMRNVFHKIGLTKAQAIKAVEMVKADRVAQAEALEKAKDTAKAQSMEALAKDWGEKTEANIKAANRALLKFFPKDFAGFMEKTGLGNHELFIRGLHKISTLISEDHLENGDGAGADSRERRIDGKPMLQFKGM